MVATDNLTSFHLNSSTSTFRMNGYCLSKIVSRRNEWKLHSLFIKVTQFVTYVCPYSSYGKSVNNSSYQSRKFRQRSNSKSTWSIARRQWLSVTSYELVTILNPWWSIGLSVELQILHIMYFFMTFHVFSIWVPISRKRISTSTMCKVILVWKLIVASSK